MVNAWISTHGIGVIKDSANSFTVTIDGGDAYVRSTSATDLTSIIYFTIPSPPENSPNLSAVRVDFSSQSAFVNSVAICFTNDEKFSQERLQKTSSFQLSISPASAVYSMESPCLLILSFLILIPSLFSITLASSSISKYIIHKPNPSQYT